MTRFLLIFLCLSALAGADPKPQITGVSASEFAALKFAADGRRLLLQDTGAYWVWDVKSGRLLAHQDKLPLLDAALSPDGSLLALGMRPRRLVVQKLESKEPVFHYDGPAVPKGKDTGGYGVSFSPKGDYLALWGMGFMREAGEPKAYLFAWPSHKLLRTFPGEQQALSCDWTGEGHLAVRSFQGIAVYDPATGSKLETVSGKLDQKDMRAALTRLGLEGNTQFDPETGRFTVRGEKIAYSLESAYGGKLSLYRGQEQKPFATLPFALSCAASADGRILAIQEKNSILLLDVDASLTAGKLVPR